MSVHFISTRSAVLAAFFHITMIANDQKVIALSSDSINVI